MSRENKGEYMKSIVQFVKKKIKQIFTHLWWYFNGKRVLRQYEEEYQREQDAETKALEEYYAKIEKEDKDRQKLVNEIQEEADDERRYQLWLKEEEFLRYGCSVCCQIDCTCNDRAENFSENYIDEEPLSPEMEYHMTRCEKCGKYPEFCPCDRKFED